MKWEYLLMDARVGTCKNIYHIATIKDEQPTYKGLIEQNELYVLGTLGRLEWELVSVGVMMIDGFETYHFFFKRPAN